MPLERPRWDCRRTVTAAAALTVMFCVLGALVGLGKLDSIDGYAVRHLMPFRASDSGGSSLLGTLVSYHDREFHPGRVLRLPASALLSTVIVLLVCFVLWTHGQRRWALLWIGAFGIGNIVELGSKKVITKPLIYAMTDGEITPVGLRHSFPSGHALRAVLVAALVTTAWPRLWPLVATWVFAVFVTLELDGIHTISDLVGGLLLAAVLILLVWAAEARFVGTATVERTEPAAGRTLSSGATRAPG